MAQQFEAIFLRQMLKGLGKTGSVGSGPGSQVYGSLVVGAVADTASHGGGIGLSEIILQAMMPRTASPERAGSEKEAVDAASSSSRPSTPVFQRATIGTATGVAATQIPSLIDSEANSRKGGLPSV